MSFSIRKYNCDAEIFPHTPPLRLASCVAAHAVIVPGVRAPNYFPALVTSLVFLIISAETTSPSSSRLKAFAVVNVMQTDSVSTCVTQPCSVSLLHPDVLRMIVCHDVKPLCLPLSRLDKVSVPFPLDSDLHLCPQPVGSLQFLIKLVFSAWTLLLDERVVVPSLSRFPAHWHDSTDIKRDNVVVLENGFCAKSAPQKKSAPFKLLC